MISVWSEDDGPRRVAVRLETPGRLQGGVLVVPDTGPAGPGEVASESPDLGGLIIHAQHGRWPELHVIAITAEDGTFSLSGLLPGAWRVWLEKADVPEGLEVAAGGGEEWAEVAAGALTSLEPIPLLQRTRPRSLRKSPPLSIDGVRWGGGSGSGSGRR